MSNLIPWRRSPMSSLQRDVEEVLEAFDTPRSFRREVDRLFGELASPRSMWPEMQSLLQEFSSPPTLRSRIERLFENFAVGQRSLSTFGREAFSPRVEVTERDDEYVMKADLPGVREQDVDLRISDDNVLTIRGERRAEETKRVRGYEYSERSFGSFSRSVSLPAGIETSKIGADFRNGVLEVHVPKTEAARSRKIPLGHEEPRILVPGNGPTVQAQRS